MAILTLKEKAYDLLRKSILHGELKPGEFLTERTLVEKYNMSRTPIRAALGRLEVEGFVNYTPNKGLIVAEMSIEKAINIYDIRIALESHITRRLSKRGLTDSEVERFQVNLAKQKQAMESGNLSEFTIADYEFHHLLAVIYQNAEVIKVMDHLHDQLFQIAIKVLLKEKQRIKVSYNDHLEIYYCIIEEREEEAAQLITQHLEFGKTILIS